MMNDDVCCSGSPAPARLRTLAAEGIWDPRSARRHAASHTVTQPQLHFAHMPLPHLQTPLTLQPQLQVHAFAATALETAATAKRVRTIATGGRADWAQVPRSWHWFVLGGVALRLEQSKRWDKIRVCVIATYYTEVL